MLIFFRLIPIKGIVYTDGRKEVLEYGLMYRRWYWWYLTKVPSIKFKQRHWGKGSHSFHCSLHFAGGFKGITLVINDDMLSYLNGKWQRKYVYWYTYSSNILDGKDHPRKENNMNTQVQNEAPQTGTVIVSEDMPEFLKRTAEGLEADGEVLVQTSTDVGSEAPVVH